MRVTFTLIALLLLPAGSFAQNKAIQDAVDQKLATIRYVTRLQAPTGEFYPAAPGPRTEPSLRATNAAVRSLKYLTGKPTKEAVPHAEKVAAFVMSCYDPKTGGFGDTPGGKPDVVLTSIGIMAAVEVDVPKEKFRKAMDYLKANAKTFEEVRIGAAAVEAWGVKDCPFDLKPWQEIANQGLDQKLPAIKDGGARIIGSITAFTYRLGLQAEKDSSPKQIARLLDLGQLADGGWAKQGAKGSDMETTYRVMRAFHMLRERPAGVAKLRGFIARCRNEDGGYGVKPGEPSNVGGVYFATIVTKWLDEMEKK